MNVEPEAEIAIETDSPELVRAITNLVAEESALTSKREGLDGATLTTLVLTITPLVVGQLFRVLRASIEAKQHVRLVHKGMTVQGVSEATLLRIIEQQSRGK
jgi:hypothetical protein